MAGQNQLTFIAEIGLSHEGDIDRACEMAITAKFAGADYAKYQFFHDLEPDLKQYEFTMDEWRRIKIICGANSIKFLASVFSVDDFEKYMRLKPEAVKLPSGAWMDRDLMAAMNASLTKLELFASLGAIGRQRVEFPRIFPHDKITQMVCTSAYPAQLDELFFGNHYTSWKGFSDHTLGTEAAAAALALGATVFEKHVGKTGPDADMAMSFSEFAEYIRKLKALKISLDRTEKTVLPCEQEMRKKLEKRYGTVQ